MASPNPSDTSAALSTNGGGLVLAKRQKLKPATNKLPPFRGGLGWKLLALLIYFTPLVGGQGVLFAQSFPVQIIPQATPPAPIYLSDYADASTVNSPLRVQIILNDFDIANREIRLKTYFEGSGISFQSNDLVVGASPLFLEGGIPLVLTNVELAPYFQFENITGISPNVYGKAIPEGAYKFCFEVYDVLTGSRLSRKSCAISVVFQNEPPFLVLPRNKVNVDEVNPQNIVFQWTPRSINVTNVEYELSLVEIWDNQVDPQAVFLSSPPIFQIVTAATTYVYGPADPLFLSGKNYAWRVQAKAKQGTEEIGLFKNQGYSEIFSFSYAGSCDLPLGVNHEVKGSTNANVFWEDFSTDVPEYTVRYRKKSPSNSPGGGENEWFLAKTTTNTLTLWDLKAGTTYEYQVRKKCTITESDWSIEKEFTTFIADDESSVYECGISPDINLSNKEPLPNISTGDAFTAGDFPIKILEISGSNGRFTGKGYVTIPYLSSIRVAVAFTNVLINTDKQLAEGTVVTVYDPTLGNLLDVDEVIDTVTDAVDAVGDLANAISEALNLDISKDTKERVNQIVDAMVANMKDEDLPEELVNQLEDAASKMKDAKEKYDNAIANGDTAAAQTAQADFNAAQGHLEDTQKEIDKYKDEVADLLKNAIFELYREGRDIENTLSSDYEAAINQVLPQIEDDSEGDFMIISVESEGQSSSTSISQLTQNFFEKETVFVKYLFSKMLNESDNEILQKFIEESKKLEINYTKIIKDLKKEKKSNTDIIARLKEALVDSYIGILSKKYKAL